MNSTSRHMYIRLTRAWLLALAAAVVTTLAVAAATPAQVGYPNSMASTGDSITRAFNTGLPFVDVPANSWSTGTNTTVNSHYARILAANSLIAGKNYNDAKTGAMMADLNGQIATAVAQHVDYVTILMGANDACTATVGAMTPVSTYQSQFRTAMNTLSAGLPNARIFVASVPDVYNLWNILHTNPDAVRIWARYSICQSLLANPTSTAPADVNRRAQVRQQVANYDKALAQVCATFIHCRFDNYAVFRAPFKVSDINTRDYFHPNIAGQAKLAAVTYATTFNFSDQTAPVSTATTTPGDGGVIVTLSATDNVGVAGIEYQLGASTAWTRYRGPGFIPTGTTLTYRAVDVNGNIEASHTLTL